MSNELKPLGLFVTLKDGMPRELQFDFNAVRVHEEVFEAPHRARVDEAVKAAGPEPSEQELLDACKRAGIPEFTSVTAAIGQWAYCLTESWREDNDERMTWQEFKRLLPARPSEIEEFGDWRQAVTQTMSDSLPKKKDPAPPAPGKSTAIKRTGKARTTSSK